MAALADFWPSETHCHQCLKTEAESLADAVFLAVHQPMRLERQPYRPLNAPATVKTEEELLDALLVRNPPSGTLVLPVTGASGVGKSHMIRWLDAHLRLRADRDRRHVVRVPKSASLKYTLRIILDGLTAPKYRALSGRLTSAKMPLNADEATWRLHAEMMLALEAAAAIAAKRVAAGERTPDNFEQRDYCNGLRLLLLDPALSQHFTDRGEKTGALARIATRCIDGGLRESGRNQFLEEDFAFLDGLDTQELAGPTRVFLRGFKTQGVRGVQRALVYLNEAVDPAVGALLSFDGVTLAELLLEVRRALLEDDLELVLLVEDFAALAGVQGSFLDAIIAHGIDTGEQRLCVMRTALAVTEGYLYNKETVTTRAQAEWRIEQRPFASEADALESFTNLVGGYLNAARWGEKRLRQDFAAGNDDERRSGSWIRNYLDEGSPGLDETNRTYLDAFGVSVRGGYPLFPFNAAAVRQLARENLWDGTSYKFEPRLLIYRLLLDTLINYRTDFVRGRFPPAGLHGFNSSRLDLDVLGQIGAKGGTERGRIETLVYYWAADPRSIEDAAKLSAEIYRAFELPPVDWSVRALPRKPAFTVSPAQPQPAVVEPTPSTTPAQPAAPELSATWESTLENWRRNGELGQSPANNLRGLLLSAIHEWLDWDSLLLKPPAVAGNKKIYLPGALNSNPSREDALAVALKPEELQDTTLAAEFFRAIRAVLRYEAQKTWDYEGGEADEALYANLIGRLATEAAAYYTRRGTDLPVEAIGPLAQALLIGARLLHLPGATANNDAENMAAIFQPAPTDLPAPGEDADAWNQLRHGAALARDNLQKRLRRSAAAYQGGGENVQALDAARLLEAIRELRVAQWQPPAALNPSIFDDPNTKQHLQKLKLLPETVAKRRADIGRRREAIVAAFGEEFNLTELTEDLRETVRLAKNGGVFRPPEPTADTLRQRAAAKDLGPVTELLNQAARACEPDADFGVTLSALAQIDDRTLVKVERLIADYQNFLDKTLAHVNAELHDAPPDPAEAAAALSKDFDELRDLWKQGAQIQP